MKKKNKKQLYVKDLLAIEDYVLKNLACRCQRCWDGIFTFWKSVTPKRPGISYDLKKGKQLPCPKCGRIYKWKEK